MDAESFVPWVSNGFYILGLVYLIMRMLDLLKRKPNVDVDFSEIKKDLDSIKASLNSKQDAELCATLHRQMDDSIREIRLRHATIEKKQSADVHGIYTRLEAVANSVSSDIGSLKGTISTYIKLREQS